jgi:hypothetical protein
VKKLIIGAAVVATTFSVSIGAVHADGSGNGASVCSNSGKPDGVVDLDGGIASGTWDSPGEVIAFLTHLVGSSAGGVRQGVANICNPNRV